MTFQTASAPYRTEGPRLHMMENHDEAYRVWKSRGDQGRILFHFDAHIDFGWITPRAVQLLEEKSVRGIQQQLEKNPLWNVNFLPDEERIHLGNFIQKALEERILSKFIWIYPNGEDPKKQAYWAKTVLENIALTAPTLFKIHRVSPFGEFEGTIHDRPFAVFPFSRLPHWVPEESVLLDIDLDFLIVQSLDPAFYPFVDFDHMSYWLSPKRLVDSLRQNKITYDCTTLSFSVEEGFTPLAMKFLGQELALRLAHALEEQHEKKFAVLRSLFDPSERRSDPQAVALLLHALESDPNDAALHYNLAMLLLKQNKIPQAKKHYWRAIELDASYRTVYNHPGPVLFRGQGEHEKALESYALMKKMDPQNPHYLLFDLEYLGFKRKWRKVLRLGQEMLKDGMEDPHLYYFLAEAYYHLKHYQQAWSLLEQHAVDFMEINREAFLYLKARIAEKLGEIQTAIEAYHGLLASFIPSAVFHLSLAKLYLQKGNSYKFRKHLAKAIKMTFLSLIATPLKQNRRKMVYA